MIFSLVDRPDLNVSFEMADTDIFCFFHSQNSIVVPAQEWSLAVATSLKMKKNVLLLESPLKQPLSINFSQRWCSGEGFLWLAPRALSVFLEAADEFSASYPSIKAFLSTPK